MIRSCVYTHIYICVCVCTCPWKTSSPEKKKSDRIESPREPGSIFPWRSAHVLTSAFVHMCMYMRILPLRCELRISLSLCVCMYVCSCSTTPMDSRMTMTNSGLYWTVGRDNNNRARTCTRAQNSCGHNHLWKHPRRHLHRQMEMVPRQESLERNPRRLRRPRRRWSQLLPVVIRPR